MMNAQKQILAAATAAFTLAITCLAGTATAQAYSYGGYGNYGTATGVGNTYSNPLTYGSTSAYGSSAYGSSYNYPFPSSYSAYPYNYAGYGGYGNSYSPTFVYRSAQSFDNSDDIYHPNKKTDLQKSTQRFRDLREDTRSQDSYYSNEIYQQNHPHDASYYNRTIR